MHVFESLGYTNYTFDLYLYKYPIDIRNSKISHISHYEVGI